MKTQNEIIKQVLVRNNRATTDGFVTDTLLTEWYRDAHVWASGYYKWPFTEGRVETTFTTGTGTNSDEYNFEGYKADSFRIVTVGGKRLTKLNFADYLIMKEEKPDSSDRVFSDFGKTLYINQNADVSGTTVAYGQYEPYIDVTDETAKTIFSDWDADANESLVEKMTVYLKRREHKFDEATLHDEMAAQKLNEVWEKIQDEQYAYQTHPEREGQYKWFPIVDERNQGSNRFNENQF
jgi:hypothetical protein